MSPSVPSPASARRVASCSPRRISRKCSARSLQHVASPRPGDSACKVPDVGAVLEEDDASSEGEDADPAQGATSACGGFGITLPIVLLVVFLNLLAVGCIVYSFVLPAQSPRIRDGRPDLPIMSDEQNESFMEVDGETSPHWAAMTSPTKDGKGMIHDELGQHD